MGKSRFIKPCTESRAERQLLGALLKDGFQLGRDFEQHREHMLTTDDFFMYAGRVPVFVDGHHHLNPRQGKRDELHDQVLGFRGMSPLRFTHNGRFTKQQLKEIVAEIRSTNNGRQTINVWEM